MIIVDANILIYAYNYASDQHTRAAQWVEKAFSGLEPVRLPWQVIHAFLRLTTQAGLLPKPLAVADAVAIVNEWLDQPALAVIDPGPRYWVILRDLMVSGRVRGAMVMDAHLAALAIEHGAALCTTDKDFIRFEGLHLLNPLGAY